MMETNGKHEGMFVLVCREKSRVVHTSNSPKILKEKLVFRSGKYTKKTKKLKGKPSVNSRDGHQYYLMGTKERKGVEGKNRERERGRKYV